MSSQPPSHTLNTNTESRSEHEKTETVLNVLLRQLENVKNENDLLKKLETEMRERIDLIIFNINVLKTNIKGNRNAQIYASNNKVSLDRGNVNKGPQIASVSPLEPTAQSSQSQDMAPPAIKHIANIVAPSQLAVGRVTNG